jgi:predicted DNA-binding protein YlxM (UPF0122 family)
LVDDIDKEANSIRQQCIKMSWYLRGGASYEDILNMSQFERQSVADLIKENLETTKSSKLPFF